MGIGLSTENAVPVSSDEKKDTKHSKNKIYAGLALAFFLFIAVGYSVYISLDWIALIAAFVFSFLTIYVNPGVIKKLTEVPVLTYYSIFLTITLFLSIDDYKNNSNMMLLLVSNILVCVSVFLSATPFVCYLFIFTNYYIVVRILLFFNSSPERDERSQYSKNNALIAGAKS